MNSKIPTPAYSAFLNIGQSSDFTVERARATIASLPWLKEVTVIAEHRFTADVGGYCFHFALNDVDEAPAEISPSNLAMQRLEVWATEPDPEMLHINDYISLLETLLTTFTDLNAEDARTGEPL